jgi:hypothetical protein
MDVETTRAPRRRGASPIVGVPVALGSLIIGVRTLGVLGTVVTAVLAFAAFLLLTRGWSAIWRKRALWRQDDGGDAVLIAPASLDGRAGVVRVFDAFLEWTHKDGEAVRVTDSQIESVALSPVPLVSGTRLTAALSDGGVLVITITAPIADVEAALSQRA